MQRSVAVAPLPPLPHRARPPQVLQAVGAVLLVGAGAAVESAHGGATTRALLLALAAIVAGFALRAARERLRSSEEVLAAGASGLAVSAGAVGGNGGPVLAGTAATAGLAVVFLVLHRAAPTTATWPLASWLAAQLAVLRGLGGVPAEWRTPLYLGVALVGLGIALSGRRGVARIALLTTAPWWVAGVASGSVTAFSGPSAARYVSAVLVVGAGLGLVLTRLRRELEPLTGPPRAAPVLAGLVGGVAVAGACSVLGTAVVTATGYAGVLLAGLTAAYLRPGWRRGLVLPLALAAGTAMTLLSTGRLVAGQEWTALSVLLLLTALPTVWAAVRSPGDRPVAVPVAVGSLAASVLLAVPGGVLSPVGAAVALTAVYAAAMAAGAELDAASRRATAVTAALAAVAAVLLVLPSGEPLALAGVLAAHGLCTLAWAGRTWATQRTAGDAELSRGAWRVGAAQLVPAAWITAAVAGVGAVEWYSLPAAAGLLLAAGPGLLNGSSWAAWGAALLVAAVPSTVLAVVSPDVPRAVAVLVAAAAVLVAGGRRGLRAPLEVGAVTALALALGLTVRALPWPVATALVVVGGVLLAVGARLERRPVAGFAVRLADLR